MTAGPPCSLLIPCYNAAATLPRLFVSARAAAVPFAEVLCYDDGSTDGTAAVAESHGARVVRGDRPKRGPSVGRNRLAREAACDWVHFQDADEEIHPQFLARTAAAAGPDADAVAVDAEWVGEESRELYIAFRYRQAEYAADPAGYLVSRPMGIHGVLYRRAAFLASGGFDETATCWEDADLHVRMAAAGARFRFLEEVLAVSLRHDRGLSRDQRHCWECRLKFLEAYAAALPPSARPAVAAQAEVAAGALLGEGDTANARRAVRLCRSLGHRVPTTANPLLRVARAVLPATTVLRLQRRARQ